MPFENQRLFDTDNGTIDESPNYPYPVELIDRSSVLVALNQQQEHHELPTVPLYYDQLTIVPHTKNIHFPPMCRMSILIELELPWT